MRLARLAQYFSFIPLAILLVACPSPSPSVTPTPSSVPKLPTAFACDQSKPVPAPGNITLTGLGYGPYHTGQDPNFGISPSEEEVAADMPTLASLTNYIRIYSSLGPADEILREAEKTHLCVNLGIWLGKYPKGTAEANAREMAAGEQLASNPAVRSLTVGNEVLLRKDMSEGQLIAAIEEVRAHLQRAHLQRAVPITVADDFNQWLAHPNLAKHVDFITVHIYPFWNGVSIDDAIHFLDMKYRQVHRAFPGKPIVIGETGWPDAGPPQGGSIPTPTTGGTPTASHPQGGAVPSPVNQARYFKAFVQWAQQNGVFYFYFDAFDEKWKTSESGVGTHWGLYQTDGHVKSQVKDVLPEADPETIRQRSFRDVYVGSSLEAPFDLGIDTSGHQHGWLAAGDGVLTLAYPPEQLWGALFITAGKPVPPGNRPSIDLSPYQSLSLDIRAEVDGQCVRLGIKDRTQPDDGSEITVQECLTTQWSTVSLPLDAFANVDLTRLYVVLEVVFLGTSSETVELRNIRYSPAQVPALSLPQPQSPFNVYTDLGDPGNHYAPTGWMGDYQDITMTQDWTADPHSGRTCIRVVYSGAASQGNGWTGVYWQDPVNNWGKTPGPIGYDLSNLSKLTFWVRGDRGGERIEFKVGGITGPYGDSLQPALSTGVLTLTTSWQLVTIDLTGQDLTHIIGGFVWVANTTNNPNGATFYLDDIVYSA
jgi:exo-beta-1,3-glucanase (GH17 family)